MNRTLRELARTDNVSDLPLFRALGDIPATPPPDQLVRIIKPRAMRTALHRTYEEAKWAELSPTYREAHNRLRRARGQQPIPPPEIDQYKPPPPQIRKFDPTDRDAVAAARGFMGAPIMGPRGGEGETIPERFRGVLGLK